MYFNFLNKTFQQQIAAAHGGTAVFGQNTPCGAKTTVWLPGRA